MTMEINRTKILFIISILISLTLACALTGEATEPPTPEGDTIATSVAETVAAKGEAASPPEDETEPEPLPEPDITYEGISFSFDPTLAASVNAESIPGEGADNPYFAFPDHLRFTFNSYALPGAFHTPVINVYSVEEFRAVNETVGETMDTLMAVIDSQPVFDEEIRVADLFGAAQYFLSQIRYLRFQNGSGVRFITQYGQDASPIGWPEMFYSFQGFTDDGAYYISAIFPITHSSLPNPDDVVVDIAFYDNFMNYTADTQMHLDLQDAETFTPSMVLLDLVMESLVVEQ
jgi:hypothetical protein